MSDLELWSHLLERGQLQMRVWYTLALWPTLVLALGACAIAWHRATREPLLPRAGAWLAAAALIWIALWPGWHVSLAPLDFLARVGFQAPERIQLVGLSAIRDTARLFDVVAYLQLASTAVALLLVVFGLLPKAALPNNQRPASSPAEQATLDLGGPLPHDDGASRLMLVVQNGLTRGARVSVGRGLVIGRQIDPLRLNDPVVSTRHASIIVARAIPQICDEGSRNGTYLERAGAVITVDRALTPLCPDDYILLGHPSRSEAIRLRVTTSADEDLL